MNEDAKSEYVVTSFRIHRGLHQRLRIYLVKNNAGTVYDFMNEAIEAHLNKCENEQKQ